MRRVLFAIACLAPAFASAQDDGFDDPAVQKALAFVRENEPRVVAYQIELTEIPAPPFHEQERAEAYREMFLERGLEDVRIDAEGNVIGVRPGRAETPRLVMSAHLDTVFPADTDVTVRREGDVLIAPGVGDDGRGLAVLLGVLDALNAAEVETEGPIAFVGTVGEEGLGDLRGVKHLFDVELAGEIDRFVSVDGAGFGITHVGVGSYRYRVSYNGPGGHSYGSFGMANPIHALGRLIDRLARLDVPAEPKTTFSVGRVGGGVSINAIASEAWLEVDMRSADAESLDNVHARFRAAVYAALADERARWDEPRGLDVELEQVGYRPAGGFPADHPVVRAAAAATARVGREPALRESSTDANVGMSLGIPSITIGGGGSGSGAHSPAERFDTTDSYLGVQRALLVAVALAGRL